MLGQKGWPLIPVQAAGHTNHQLGLPRRQFLRDSTAAIVAALLPGCKPNEQSAPPAAKVLAAAPLTKAAEIYSAMPGEFKDSSGAVVATTKKLIQVADAKRTLVIIKQIYPNIVSADLTANNAGQPSLPLVHPCQNSIDVVLRELKANPKIAANQLYAEGATATSLKANVEQAYNMAALLNIRDPERNEYLMSFVGSQSDPEARNWLKAHMANSAAHRQFYSGQMQPMVTEPEDYPATKKYLIANNVLSREEFNSLQEIFLSIVDPAVPADSPLRTNFVTNIGYFLVYKQDLEERLIGLKAESKAVLLKDVKAILDRVLRLDDTVSPQMKTFALAAHHILAGGYKPTNGNPITHLANVYKEIFKERRLFAVGQMLQNPNDLAVMVDGAMNNWQSLIEEANRINSAAKFNLIEVSPKELAGYSSQGLTYDQSVELMVQGYAQLKGQFKAAREGKKPN
jgi:hypothetical protein